MLVPVEQSNLIFSVFNFKKTSWKQRASLYLDLYKIDRYGQARYAIHFIQKSLYIYKI